MEKIGNFCLYYTRQSLDDISHGNINRKFYIISEPSKDEVYDCSTKSVSSYGQLARTSFGKRTLSDIDAYTLGNFFNEKDFFECLGLSLDAFYERVDKRLVVNRKLFIAQVMGNGWVNSLTPLFNNDELLEKIKNANLKYDCIVDTAFSDRVYTMLADSDRRFYDYLKSTFDEKDSFSGSITDVRYIERKDVQCKNDFVLDSSFNKSRHVRNSFTRGLNFYPTYRKVFLAVDDFNKKISSESSIDDDDFDAYSEITGIPKSKRRN